jgi:hypothetical protein
MQMVIAFTIADQIRHIAAIERLYVCRKRRWKKKCVQWCGKELADGYENVLKYFNDGIMNHLRSLKT